MNILVSCENIVVEHPPVVVQSNYILHTDLDCIIIIIIIIYYYHYYYKLLPFAAYLRSLSCNKPCY